MHPAAPTGSRSCPSRQLLRRGGVGLVAATLALATMVSGCGGASKPTVAAVRAAIAPSVNDAKSDLYRVPSGDLTCVARVLQKYGATTSLDQLVKGTISADKLQGVDAATAMRSLKACVRR